MFVVQLLMRIVSKPSNAIVAHGRYVWVPDWGPKFVKMTHRLKY
jgi:hypothetical protein